MKFATVWFDLASPETAEWFARWPDAIEGLGLAIDWQPVATDDAEARAWLRLLLASAPPGGTPSRWACAQVLQLVDGDTPKAMAARLRPLREPAAAEIDAELVAAAGRAREAGATSFPAVSVGGQTWSGLDGLTRFAQHPGTSP